MDVRELRYFVQIAKERSFTKAARSLFISQPALSKMMRKLEKELGVALFIIRPDGVRLTDYGTALYERSVPLLREFEELGNLVTDFRKIPRGKLTVGVSPLLGAMFMVDIFADFREMYPEIDLQLVEACSNECREMLNKRELDAGICIPGEEGLTEEDTVLYEDAMSLCVHVSSPLTEQDAVSFADLKDEYFNICRPQSVLYSQIISRCVNSGFSPKINMTSSQIGMVLRMVQRGQGICIVPRPLVPRFLPEGVRLVPFSESFPWTVCLVRPKDRCRSYIEDLFGDFVVSYFKENRCGRDFLKAAETEAR